MHRRLQILGWTISKRTFGGPLSDWLKTMLAPRCDVLAKRKITSIEKDGDFFQLRLNGVSGTLFVDASQSLHSIYQTIVEQMYSWQWHYFETPETKIDGEEVADCGSAEGIFPFLTRSRAEKLYLFEPLPDFVKGLDRTFRNDAKVEIVNAALASKPGQAYLKRAGIASSIVNTPTDTPVEVMSLDSFETQRRCSISYIKADLEGFEVEMLRGAKEVIRANKPKIAITTYHVASHAEEIRRLLLHINPSYRLRVRGVEERTGAPVMLHAWT